MCRSIKTLRQGPILASDDEISAAALQFVRKVSGYRKPSAANEEAFNAAVEEIAATSRQLLEAVAATHPQARQRHRSHQHAHQGVDTGEGVPA